MVEAVMSVFLMTVILPLFIIMISSTLNTRATATSIMSNTVNSAAAQTSLNNDIETASAVKVTDGNLLNLRLQDGSCKAWKLKDGNLVRASSDSTITGDSNWQTIGEHFAPIESVEPFQKDSAGTIEYNFNVGKSETTNELRGSATPNAASSGSGDCW
jgi:hypothetical protein